MQSSETDPQALARKLSSFLRHLATVSDGEFLEAVSQEDLSLSQLKVLSLLADAPEELAIKEVAETLGISLPSASRAIDPLVRRKLMDRQEDEADRRVKRLRLTDKGSGLVDRLLSARVSTFTAMLADFSDAERRKLAGALDAILDRPEFAGYRREQQKARA